MVVQSGWIEDEYQMDIGYHCVEGIVLEIHQDLFGAVGNIFLPYTCGYQNIIILVSKVKEQAILPGKVISVPTIVR